jgi:hypothetical protein
MPFFGRARTWSDVHNGAVEQVLFSK